MNSPSRLITQSPSSSSLAIFVASSLTYAAIARAKPRGARNRRNVFTSADGGRGALVGRGLGAAEDGGDEVAGNEDDDDGSTAGIATSTPLLSFEETLSLRRKHMSRSLSLSYSNSGPLMMVGGSGCRLFDERGTSYLDTRNNVAHCGHNHPRVVSAIQRQVSALNTNTRYLHPNAALLASRLVGMFPPPLNDGVVFFVNSGSEANDLALRLARARTSGAGWCRNTIVVGGAYHGHTLSTVEISPYKFERSDEFPNRGPPPYVKTVSCPDTYRGPHRGPDAADRYARYVKEACDDHFAGQVSAFVVEGGMNVAGVVLPPPGYLRMAAGYVRDAGGVYIADEVQTGFGRFGSCLWGFQHDGGGDGRDADDDNAVVPDIVTVGKPFGNGMPLAAVVASRDVAEPLENSGVEYFNTFGGNPVCTAAGLAVLDVLESDGLQRRADEVGSYLVDRLGSLGETVGLIGDVRGSGLFVGIEFVRDRTTLEPAAAETSFICTVLKTRYHILTSIDGPHDNVMVVKPPIVFGEADVDEFVRGLELAITVDMKGVNFNVEGGAVSHTPT